MRIRKKTIVWLLLVAGAVAGALYCERHWTPPWIVSDLSMRFMHPELYESRDGLPRYTALYEFRQRGLLHRGMAATDIRMLLGEPPQKSEHETSNDSPNVLWLYSLHASSLTIEFDPEGNALSFTETTDGDNSKTTEW